VSFSTYFEFLFFHVYCPLACFDFKSFIYVQKLVSTYLIPSFSNGVKESHFYFSNKKIGLLLLNELINKSALGRPYWTRPSESGPGMEVPVPGNVSICHKQRRGSLQYCLTTGRNGNRAQRHICHYKMYRE